MPCIPLASRRTADLSQWPFRFHSSCWCRGEIAARNFDIKSSRLHSLKPHGANHFTKSTTYPSLPNLSPPPKPRLHSTRLAHLRAPSRGVLLAEPGAAPAGSSRTRASGTLRVTVRSNYVGLPLKLAGRGPAERRRKPPGSGKSPPAPEERSRGAKSPPRSARGRASPRRRPTPSRRAEAHLGRRRAKRGLDEGRRLALRPL